MGGTFVITLREGFEAALVLGLIYTYLDKIGARREFRYVTAGALLGVAASLLLGLMVTVLSGPLVDLGPDLIGAAVLFAASGTLTWHGWWMRLRMPPPGSISSPCTTPAGAPRAARSADTRTW